MKHFRNIIKLAVLLVMAVGLSFCNKPQSREWHTCFGFTAEELKGGYHPNDDDWEKDIPEEVENAHPVKNASASITQTSDNTIIVNVLGLPKKVDKTFSCTILPNDFMFNSGNLTVQVFKSDEGGIRLKGDVRHKIGQLYDEALGNPANGYIVDINEHYYFDVIKK